MANFDKKAIKKILSYAIPVLLCAFIITVIFVGYFKYEYKMEIARSIAAPIGVSACFLCFCIAEIICIRFDKYNTAMVLAIVKFVLLFFGLITVFAQTLSGLGFMLILGLAIPVFLPVAIAGFALRALFFVALVLFYIGVILEPIIISENRTKKEKSAVDNLQ